MIGFVLGLLFVAHLAVLPNYTTCVFIALSLFAWQLAIRLVDRLNTLPAFLRLNISGLLLGLLWASVYGHYQLQWRLAPEHSGQIWQLQGQVVGSVRQYPNMYRFTLAVESTFQRQPKLRKVRLSWYRPNRSLKATDRLVLSAVLKSPIGPHSQGGFDRERWALMRGIDAQGYVKQLQSISAGSWHIERWREQLALWIDQHFSQARQRAALKALLLGDGGEINAQQWQWLRTSGTVHLLVVSGLHIGIAVLCGWYLGMALRAPFWWLRWRWRFLEWLPALLALGLSLVYVLLSGMGLSAQRAWIMAAVLLLAGFSRLRPTMWQRWCWALALVAALQPLAVLAAGFWLSFIAVAIIILLCQWREAKRWRFVRLQLAIGLMLMPLTLAFFEQVSWLGPLVNGLAIPLVSLFVALLAPCLLLIEMGFTGLIALLAALIDSFWWCLENIFILARRLPTALSLPLYLQMLLALLGALILLPLGRWLRAVAVCGLLLLLLKPSVSEKLAAGQFSVEMVDVGQGLALLVSTANHHLLYDTGVGFPSGYTAFKQWVLPVLRAKQVDKLALLMISHGDSDHAGGAAEVANWLEVERVLSGTPEQLPIAAEPCLAGQTWRWSGVEFALLHPSPGAGELDNNDRSCVLLITGDRCQLLLTGDISKAIESQLQFAVAPDHQRLLQLGHHGSNSSSGEALLAKFQPDAGLVSAGFANRYGHPHPQVLARAGELAVEVWRTDLQGSVSMDSQCRLSSFSDTQRRYWHLLDEH